MVTNNSRVWRPLDVNKVEVRCPGKVGMVRENSDLVLMWVDGVNNRLMGDCWVNWFVQRVTGWIRLTIQKCWIESCWDKGI